jgi:hypothetical protein
MYRDEENGDVWGLLAGTGVFLLEICVLVPGLLAGLILAAGLALPFLLPAIPLALLGGIYLALRAFVRLLIRIPKGVFR